MLEDVANGISQQEPDEIYESIEKIGYVCFLGGPGLYINLHFLVKYLESEFIFYLMESYFSGNKIWSKRIFANFDSFDTRQPTGSCHAPGLFESYGSEF